ncbi:MAG: alkaline phosphatase family protein [Vicinamibacteria bacterium]
MGRLLGGTALALALGGAAWWWLARPGEPRVIVVGLDAADWQLLDGYRGDGTMPNLDRLVREGRSGVLRSFKPHLSPLVWTTMMTGTSPLRHRILDFTRFDPATGAREPITADERQEKAVWEMAGDQGKDVAVVGMWATHPAEPVKGLMVSDRLFAFYVRDTPAAGLVHPAAEEARVLAERRKVEAEVSLAALQAYLPQLTAAELERLRSDGNPWAHPETALERILVETRLYHRLAVEWIRTKRPALSIVYLEGTDTIGHVFAAYAPPRQDGIDPADFERYQSVPRTFFREVDGLLGEYRALAEETGATLLVVSDHGFLWKEGRPRTSGLQGATAGLWHRAEGMFLLWGRGVEASAGRGEGRVGQVTATILGLLGLPRAAGTEGPALAGVPEVLPARNYGVRQARPAAAAAATAGGAAAGEAVDRLKALGYVGPASRRRDLLDGAASTRHADRRLFVNEATLPSRPGRRRKQEPRSRRPCASTRTSRRRSTTSRRCSRRKAARARPTSFCWARSATGSTPTTCRSRSTPGSRTTSPGRSDSWTASSRATRVTSASGSPAGGCGSRTAAAQRLRGLRRGAPPRPGRRCPRPAGTALLCLVAGRPRRDAASSSRWRSTRTSRARKAAAPRRASCARAGEGRAGAGRTWAAAGAPPRAEHERGDGPPSPPPFF